MFPIIQSFPTEWDSFPVISNDRSKRNYRMSASNGSLPSFCWNHWDLQLFLFMYQQTCSCVVIISIKASWGLNIEKFPAVVSQMCYFLQRPTSEIFRFMFYPFPMSGWYFFRLQVWLFVCLKAWSVVGWWRKPLMPPPPACCHRDVTPPGELQYHIADGKKGQQ